MHKTHTQKHSPHLHTVRERIRIGDHLIPEADFVRLWDVVQVNII